MVVFNQLESGADTPIMTMMVMQWGQFISHDVSFTPMSRGFNKSMIKCCREGQQVVKKFKSKVHLFLTDTNSECENKGILSIKQMDPKLFLDIIFFTFFPNILLDSKDHHILSPQFCRFFRSTQISFLETFF